MDKIMLILKSLSILSISSLTSKLGAVLVLILAFFSPIAILFYMIIALVVVDLLTAVPKHWAKRNITGFWNRVKSISSRGLRSTVVKLVLYILFVGSVYLFSMAVFKHDIYAANFVAGLIGLTELRSIAENCDIVTGKSLFTQGIQKVTKMFESKITEVTSKPEDL